MKSWMTVCLTQACIQDPRLGSILTTIAQPIIPKSTPEQLHEREATGLGALSCQIVWARGSMSIYNAVLVALEVLLHLSERHAGFGNAPLEVISIMCGNTSPLFLWSYWD